MKKKLNVKIEIIIFMNLLSFIQYTETLARRLVINTPQHHKTHKPLLIFFHFQVISLPSLSFSSSLLFLKNPRFHFFLTCVAFSNQKKIKCCQNSKYSTKRPKAKIIKLSALEIVNIAQRN